MKDEIIEEVWRSKEAIAQLYDYDLDKLAKALRAKEKDRSIQTVDFSQSNQPTKVDQKLVYPNITIVSTTDNNALLATGHSALRPTATRFGGR